MGHTKGPVVSQNGFKVGTYESSIEVIDELGRMYLNFEPGSQFYVDATNGSATGDGLTWATAVTTITLALAKCTASKGDVIWVAPWHAETISGAAGIVFNKIGVTVIGLGKGSLRPTITYDTAATTDIDITADNTTIKNVRFVCDFEDIAQMIDLSAKNCTFEDCEFLDKEVDHNCVHYIECHSVNNACDGLTVRRCVAISPDVANDHFIAAVGDIDRLTVEDCYINLGLANGEAIIEATTGKDFTNCKILRNVLIRLNTSDVMIMESDTADNSGVIAFNFMGHADTATAIPLDVSGAHYFENYSNSLHGEVSGLLLPTADDNA